MKKGFPICLVLLIIGIFGLSQAALAQDKYPSKPVEIIVSWAAGGATDVLFRALGAVSPDMPTISS
jgi:tripartite-type tricarboxylate transporter receptor subunit TctC